MEGWCVDIQIYLWNNKYDLSEWVSEWLSLMAFLGTVESEVCIVHISHVITAYTCIGIIIFPHIDNTQSTGHN